MKSIKFTLAALLLAAAATSGAGVPVIELAPSPDAQVQAIEGGAAQLVGQNAPAPAAQTVAAAPQEAGMLFAARPKPSFGAFLLLLLGCIIYQGRRNRQGLALRPSRTLFERFSHAPARA